MQLRFVLAALVAMVGLAVATPPACLLAVMGIQSNPADLKLMCGGVQSAVLGNMTEACQGDSLSPAYNVYSSTCSGVGVKVAALPSATTTSSGSSPTASHTGSGSGSGTTTGSGANPTASGKNNAAGMAPSFMFAVTGLLATTLGSIVFL